MRIEEAARRYVHEQAPIPPAIVLERVATIVLQSRTSGRPVVMPTEAPASPGEIEAA